ncbi:hypothetical protein [Halomonas caseinilytica]|uniref:hypothetical protein n=1 Tax=Halomonas caseinilytica TaxID=438744 RepID=UPI0010BE6AA7|nr:hypothetical protein [Halomonas caseinilytica]
MLPKIPLKSVRQAWIEACANGQADWLDYIESPSFFIKKGGDVITKKDQLWSVERSRKKHSLTDKKQFSFSHLEEEIHERDGWAVIKGFGCVKINNKEVNSYGFLELWVVLDGRWKIASICYNQHPQSS